MERPLWQILIALVLGGAAAQRGAVAAALWSQGALTANLVAIYALQSAAAVVAAVGVWRGGRMAVVGVIALGATVGATALAGLAAGILSPFSALAQLGVAALAAGALTLVFRHEFGPRGTGVRSGG